MANKKHNIDKEPHIVEEDEIDLVEVAKTIWENRRTIYKTMAVFIVLGLIVAFGSKVEYEASCKLLPDAQDTKMPGLGGLGGLAGLAGINLDFGGQGGLSPELYPQIVQSLPFQLEIINKELTFEKKDTVVSSYIYFKELDSPSLLGYLKGYTIGLPGKVRKWISKNEVESKEPVLEPTSGKIIRLNKEDTELIENFKDRITTNVDDKTGIISITVGMPDPVAAAELTRRCVELLQVQVINFKINKAKENLQYIKERHKEARNKFETAQEKLASFDDRNINVITARAQSERLRLQNEFNLTFEILKSLSTQLEQAEMKVKEDTPVFSIVEPVKIPVDKSKPKRRVLMIVAIVIGLFTGILIILVRNYRQFIIKKNKAIL